MENPLTLPDYGSTFFDWLVSDFVVTTFPLRLVWRG